MTHTPSHELPRVSVIMPVYNTERYVREAIESVLAEASVNLELICINDGSTDGSANAIAAYGNRITLIESGTNEGIGAARNRGLAAARGAHIAFMDADDRWIPGKLRAQLTYLEAHPECDLVFTHMRCFLSPDLSPEIRAMRYCNEAPVPGVLSATLLARRRAFDRVGTFNPSWRVGEFIDWLSRAESREFGYHVLPEVYLERRVHATNTGVTERPARVDYVRIVREALERKRRDAAAS